MGLRATPSAALLLERRLLAREILATVDILETLRALPRSNKKCTVCDHEEAVFFQSQQRSAETGMKLFYVCCECGLISA
ncbi:hypothetical protein E4U56_001624 [Claviceps arundinis]|uniref:DNA-directed RNA polymerase II subunit RPB9 n=1 Tax=Claviceps arundinis TaxID=1623583 RepID=A0A9P7SPV9_9HYPO|nr:hypothetical protein E4U56_001624 [Claviceps arundinis]